MEQDFGITDGEEGGLPVVSVTGEIDVATAPALREHLQRQVTGGATTVVVDLLGVSFLDSTALGVLVGVLKRCREAGGDLRLVIAQPRILKVFEITGLTSVFTIRDSVAAAVGAGR